LQEEHQEEEDQIVVAEVVALEVLSQEHNQCHQELLIV
jgi:hypothetical protein